MTKVIVSGHQPKNFGSSGNPADLAAADDVIIAYVLDLSGWAPGDPTPPEPIVFVLGVAEGWDLMVARAVFLAIDRYRAPFEVWVGNPWPGFCHAYANKGAHVYYRRTLERAAIVHTIADEAPKTPDGFWDWTKRRRIFDDRNAWMISCADPATDTLLILLDPDRKKTSGTKSTLAKAQKRGMNYVNAWNDVIGALRAAGKVMQ